VLGFRTNERRLASIHAWHLLAPGGRRGDERAEGWCSGCRERAGGGRTGFGGSAPTWKSIEQKGEPQMKVETNLKAGPAIINKGAG